MSRTITAIYRSSATANLVRQGLEQLGIGRHHVTILPDADVTGRSDRTQADLDDAFDQLHGLGLPEDDTRTYPTNENRPFCLYYIEILTSHHI